MCIRDVFDDSVEERCVTHVDATVVQGCGEFGLGSCLDCVEVRVLFVNPNPVRLGNVTQVCGVGEGEEGVRVLPAGPERRRLRLLRGGLLLV